MLKFFVFLGPKRSQNLPRWPQIKKGILRNVSKIKFYNEIHLRQNSWLKILFSQKSHRTLVLTVILGVQK